MFKREHIGFAGFPPHYFERKYFLIAPGFFRLQMNSSRTPQHSSYKVLNISSEPLAPNR